MRCTYITTHGFNLVQLRVGWWEIRNEMTMAYITQRILISGITSVLCWIAANAFAQVPEIPDSNLPDIAQVRPDPIYGAVIIYNPNICVRIGHACGFFRAHEYGHVVLGHAYLDPAAFPAVREASADCWAAQNGNPIEIFAAYQLFLAGGSSTIWQVYGNPIDRAQRVQFCAMQAGKWIGPP